MLVAHETVLAVIDVQGALYNAMHQKELLLEQVQKLIAGCRALEVPVVWTEQNPGRLGATIPEVSDLLQGIVPIPKMSFSCCGCDAFMAELVGLDRKSILLCGIEAHICVYQTAADLAGRGYSVEIVADAVSSRTADNRDMGLHKAQRAGGAVTSTETVLFEMLRSAENPGFRQVAKLIK